MKITLSRAGDLLAHVAMAYLTLVAIMTGLPLNPATWALWFIIDFVVILALKKAGKNYSLMLAFIVWTGLILAISLYNLAVGRATFTWGATESLAVASVIGALVIWKASSGENTGVFATTLALVMAGVPTWFNSYENPHQTDILFWSTSATACVLSFLGSPKTLGDRFMPAAGALSNGVIIALSLTRYA